VSVPAGASFGADATLAANDAAKLVFQSDGNLVLYRTTPGPQVALWASNTAGRQGTQAAFQPDGNLVIYRADGRPVWASGSNDNGNKMVLQPSGNVTIHNAAGNLRWQTGTSVPGAGDSDIGVGLKTSLELLGQHVDVPAFQVAASPDALTKLPETVAKKVEEALRSVFNDVNKWVDAVGKGVVDGVQDTEKVLKDVYKKSEQEAKALAKTAGKGVNTAEKAVEGAAKDTGKAVESAAKDVGKGAKKAFKKAKFW